MERLTRWNEQTEQAELVEYDTEEWKDFKSTLVDVDYIHVLTAIDKLATYEDAEENGLLLSLPCKVGDYVWDLWSGYRFEVMGIELHMNRLIIFRCGNKGTGDYAAFYLDEIEDRWSLSEPQGPTKAEKALAEMG